MLNAIEIVGLIQFLRGLIGVYKSWLAIAYFPVYKLSFGTYGTPVLLLWTVHSIKIAGRRPSLWKLKSSFTLLNFLKR